MTVTVERANVAPPALERGPNGLTMHTERPHASTMHAPTMHAPKMHAPSMHWPALLTAIAIMLGGTAFPFAMADARGRADHTLAMLLFWAMAAGFVRGVGFVPRHRIARWLLSAWACAFALVAFAAVKGLT